MMLRTSDEGHGIYPFASSVVQTRIQAPPAPWRRRGDFDSEPLEPARHSPRDGLNGPARRKGDPPVNAAPVRRILDQWQARYGLTPSELAVLDLLSQGMTPASIARERCTSLGTVRAQLKTIFDKTTYRSQQAILAALLQGSDGSK